MDYTRPLGGGLTASIAACCIVEASKSYETSNMMIEVVKREATELSAPRLGLHEIQ